MLENSAGRVVLRTNEAKLPCCWCLAIAFGWIPLSDSGIQLYNPVRGRFAGRDSECRMGTRAGIIHVNLEGFAVRFRCYEAEAGKDGG